VKTITTSSAQREEMIDITSEAQALLTESGVDEGICVLFAQHTTCGLTINENADPDVKGDMLGFLERLIPQYEPHFRHFEHNSDAHIKSSLVGSSVQFHFPMVDCCLAAGRGSICANSTAHGNDAF